MENFSFVYVTTQNREEAKTIGKQLLQEHLAACVNIIDGMVSYFWWDEKISKTDEAVLLIKTRSSKLPEITERIKTLHSYDCPCVLEIPLGKGGNQDYHRWLLEKLHS